MWEHTIPTCVLNATYFVPYHVLLFALISIFSSLCAWLWIEFVTWNVASTLEWSARCMFRPVAELIIYCPSAKTRPLYIKLVMSDAWSQLINVPHVAILWPTRPLYYGSRTQQNNPLWMDMLCNMICLQTFVNNFATNSTAIDFLSTKGSFSNSMRYF